jgi:clathrin heavy chain
VGRAKVASGLQDPGLYNALAKILQAFLTNNNVPTLSKAILDAYLLQLYEPLVVGKYCEKRDPSLAYIAYAKYFCDEELIATTDNYSSFKQQARYFVKHRRLEPWG